MSNNRLKQSISDLITTYHELNGDIIHELKDAPSALQFTKYVARNQPFVIRNGASEWPAVRQWTAQHLMGVMGDAAIKVAVTPRGNADSVVRNPDDQALYFVKPMEVDESFTKFLHYVQEQERGTSREANVKYAQTQNDNLRGEYLSLYKDVEKDIAWARIALGQKAEAVNLWLGNSRSVTALHRDNYENIYCQMIGSKHFILIPPVEVACIHEEEVLAATYAFDPESGSASGKLILVPDIPRDTIPCATWDPDQPMERRTSFSHLSKPLRVDINAGDMLYLPALWYHKVSQSCSDEGICCAVNYWYDMDFGGTFYSSNAFIRNISLCSNERRAGDDL